MTTCTPSCEQPTEPDGRRADQLPVSAPLLATDATAKLQKARVFIVGLGLIGGSLAAALVARRTCKQVIGWDQDGSVSAQAQRLGLVDSTTESLAEGVGLADVVVLATPVLAISALLRTLSCHELKGKVLTDVGSCKGDIVAAARQHLGNSLAGFVPGHPIAGSERSGILAASPELYKGHTVIVTPLPESSDEARLLVRSLWEGIGADIVEMDIEHHDSLLARTSHLPHMLAFSLVDTLAAGPENLEIFRYAAGGFRDFTRIAASDPGMWHDVCMANRKALLAALHEFQKGLEGLQAAIDSGNRPTLLGIMTRAKAAREHFSHMLAKRPYTDPMSQNSLSYRSEPGGTVRGTLTVPGDKSISHRAIMLGALASGVTTLSGFLEGEDALATLQAFRDMGVVIDGPHDNSVTIYGVGLHGLTAPPNPLYFGNSGTAMRLMAGLMAAQSFDVTLTGDASLSHRPMARVIEPLTEMGGRIHTNSAGTPPLAVTGGQSLTGIDYSLPVASAQVKSSILLAGLYASGTTSVVEPGTTRDHTERMLASFGYPVSCSNNRISLTGGGKLVCAGQLTIPADLSSACLLYTSPSPRDRQKSRMPSSA